MRLYLVHPFDSAGLDGRIFRGPFGLLRDLFADAGIQLETSDQHELSAAERVLFFNHDRRFYKRCVDAGLDRERLVLFMFEPPATIPAHADERVWSSFGTIFTYDDRLIDGRSVSQAEVSAGAGAH